MKRLQQRKTKTVLDAVLDLALILPVCIIIYAVWNLSGILMDYHGSEKLYDSLQDQYVTETDEIPSGKGQESAPGRGTERQLWYEKLTVDLKSLKELNPDIVGWLYQEDGERISYPVLYSGDNAKYLRRLADGSSATAGSLFLEAGNSPDFEDSHMIIYGHNMHNLSMFGTLKAYHDKSYYKAHQYFQVFTEKGIYRYRVFAYSVVDKDSPVYSVPCDMGGAFADFIQELYRSSEIQTGVTATDTDRILTLSTCASGEKRFVVHSVLVDTHLYESNNELRRSADSEE